MPNVLSKSERKTWFIQLKQQLWTGQIKELIKEVKDFCQEKTIEIKDKLLTEINGCNWILSPKI